jgi:hypothetical protein
VSRTGRCISSVRTAPWYASRVSRDISRIAPVAHPPVLAALLDFCHHRISPARHGATLLYVLTDQDDGSAHRDEGIDIRSLRPSIVRPANQPLIAHQVRYRDGAVVFDPDGTLLNVNVFLLTRAPGSGYLAMDRGKALPSLWRCADRSNGEGSRVTTISNEPDAPSVARSPRRIGAGLSARSSTRRTTRSGRSSRPDETRRAYLSQATHVNVCYKAPAFVTLPGSAKCAPIGSASPHLGGRGCQRISQALSSQAIQSAGR